MDTRRNQLIVGGVVIVAVIVVIVIIANKSSSPACELQNEQPKIDSGKVKTIISSENNVLLRFAGYVNYEKTSVEKDDKTYLALGDTQTVTFKQGDSHDKNTVTAEAECASLILSIDSEKENKYQIGPVKLDAKASGLKGPDDKSCTLSLETSYARGKHYSCNKEKSYQCKNKDKVVATVIITNLEFEVNGNAEQVKKGAFTTPADECS